MFSCTAASILLWAFFVHAQDAKLMAPIYLDNTEYLGNASNIIGVSLPVLQAALKNPNSTNETSVNGGYDWTKPYTQAAKILGHKARLRIAYDIPIPESLVHNSTTAVASLSFSVPKGMMGTNGLPKSMDPTWALCRHIYISKKIDATKATESDSCSFLPAKCVGDIKSSLTKDWMTQDPEFPCSGLGFDPIPVSCEDSFGFARAEVSIYDSTALANTIAMKAMAVDEESESNWRIGTGIHDKGDKFAYETATNRTYLIVDVWGYSKKLSGGSKRVPDATLTCLSARSKYSKTKPIVDKNRPSSSLSSSPSSASPNKSPTAKASGQSFSGARGQSPPQPGKIPTKNSGKGLGMTFGKGS